MTQCQQLEKLLLRKRGVSAMEIITLVGTVCPHKRMSDLKGKGWAITRCEVAGKNYGRYFGTAPKAV